MRPSIAVLMKRRADGRVELRAPGVGLWREAPVLGALLRPGMKLGALEVLGALSELVVPEGAAGIAVELADPSRARRPVGHGDVLVLLDPNAAGQAAVIDTKESVKTASGLIFASPMSGRFYGRPSPDKPAFVSAGEEIGPGHTIGLLEVMKTFNRITYGGPHHPERARVKRVVPRDGDDLAAGDALLELEPIETRCGNHPQLVFGSVLG